MIGAGRTSTRRRGMVLIVTMLVLFALAGMVLVMGRAARVEAAASANAAAQAQALAIERGAEQYVLGILAGASGGAAPQLGDDDLAGIGVGDGYFWVVRPPDVDAGSTQIRFGLSDEAGKINLNTVDPQSLLRLTLIPEELAAAIIDWRDPDDTVLPNGAESETYLALADGYYSKNADFETVEELLLVRGMTRSMLYGDPSSDAAGALFSSPWTRLGLYDLFTVYSAEPNTSADGARRVNLADPTRRQQLRDAINKTLGSSRANAIVAAMGAANYRDLFEFAAAVKLTADELDQLADVLTGSNAAVLRGRININSAPKDILRTLPGLEESDVDQLLARRPAAVAAKPTGIAWVADALGTKAIGLGNQITSRSFQYSADIIAVAGNGRGLRRCRIVVDVSDTTPRIAYRRDITERGWPLDATILDSLRRGEGLNGGAGGGSVQ